MKFGVVVFPGSNCDYDTFHVLQNVMEQETVFLWHKDSDLKDVDCVVLPGGFSYGDYLRSGAIARFSPIMTEVKKICRSRRAGAGHLQRFPDSAGSGTFTRCHVEKQKSEVSLPARLYQD